MTPVPPTYLRRERRVVTAALIAGGVAAVGGAIAGGVLGDLAWAGLAMADEAYPDDGDRRLSVTIAVGIAAALAVLVATPASRPLLRFLGMRPQDHVHRVALFLALGLTVVCLAALAGTGGRALLIDSLAKHPETDLQESALDSLLPLIWIIPGAFLLVGYGVHRGGAVTLDRLGLRWPGRRGLALGVVVGVALVPCAIGLGFVLEHASSAIGLPVTQAEDLERLFALPSLTIGTGLALAVAAGVGEELAVRGVLQPRLGLVLANLFFASLHALQYTLDGVIVVFLLGLAFGVVRRRTTTVASMAAHVVYDFALFVLVIADVI